MSDSPKFDPDSDRFHPPKAPSDRDLMIRYRCALESVYEMTRYSNASTSMIGKVCSRALLLEESP